MASGADYGWISIRSDCDWHGNSSMGGFLSIRVDGKRGGAVAPLDTERVPVYPGSSRCEFFFRRGTGVRAWW